MFKKTLVWSLLAVASNAQADKWHIPARGTVERAQVVDALRTRMQDYYHQPVVFMVREMCLSSTRGWLSIRPRTRDGRKVFETLDASLIKHGGAWEVDFLACPRQECRIDANTLRSKIAPQCK